MGTCFVQKTRENVMQKFCKESAGKLKHVAGKHGEVDDKAAEYSCPRAGH